MAAELAPGVQSRHFPQRILEGKRGYNSRANPTSTPQLNPNSLHPGQASLNDARERKCQNDLQVGRDTSVMEKDFGKSVLVFLNSKLVLVPRKRVRQVLIKI